MFRFHKPLDTVTLFHKASSPASMRVLALLKQASAKASTETSTADQEQQQQQQQSRSQFELNVTEDPPTSGQLETILEYIGQPAIPSVIKGTHSIKDALKKFQQSPDSFERPVVVDWNNGKAFAGANESKILQMLNSIPKEDSR